MRPKLRTCMQRTSTAFVARTRSASQQEDPLKQSQFRCSSSALPPGSPRSHSQPAPRSPPIPTSRCASSSRLHRVVAPTSSPARWVRHVEGAGAAGRHRQQARRRAPSSAPTRWPRARPTATRVLVATFAHAVNPSMQPKLPYRLGQGIRAGDPDRSRPERAGGAGRQPVQERQGRDRGGQGQSGQADLRVARQRHLRAPCRRDCSPISPRSR